MTEFGGRTTNPVDTSALLAKATLTAKGDLYVATASGVVTRLAVGTNDQVLTADSAQAAGVKWATAAGGSGGGNAYDPTVLYLQDTFTTGTGSSGQIGQLGWNFTGTSASVTMLATETGRVGIARLTSNSVNPSTAAWHLRATPTTGILLPGDLPWDIGFMLRANLNGGTANTSMFRVGLSPDPGTTGDPSHGIYFEKLAADTNWFAVTRSSSVQTRTDTGVAYADATFVRFRIRRETSGGNILFSVNAGTDISHSANIPTAALHPFAMERTTEAVAKTLDFHRFYLKVTGITGGNVA